MNHFDDRPAAAPRPLQARREARSLLVRLWVEPRESDGRPGPLRGVVRDLRSGAESYVSTPEELAVLMTRQAQALEGGLEPAAGAPPSTSPAAPRREEGRFHRKEEP